jgi:two-component system, OmpR family, response regulator RegX3
MSARVLVVEDEESYVEALQAALTSEGFQVDVATDGVAALEQFERAEPDVVLLDVMLPRLSGIEVCRQLRSRSRVPIIMVTARADEIDTVVGLEVGADDYVTKPYRVRELIARTRAVLRRAAADAAPTTALDGDDVLEDGDLRLDLSRHELTVAGRSVHLPLKEFELLELLMDNPGRVVTRETLLDRIWGYDYVGDTKTLDVHVKRLRSKIEDDPSNPTRITTVRGVGYRFEPQKERT